MEGGSEGEGLVLSTIKVNFITRNSRQTEGGRWQRATGSQQVKWEGERMRKRTIYEVRS